MQVGSRKTANVRLKVPVPVPAFAVSEWIHPVFKLSGPFFLFSCELRCRAGACSVMSKFYKDIASLAVNPAVKITNIIAQLLAVLAHL